MGDRAKLTALSRGFRTSYLSYGEITEQLHAWSEAFPHLVRTEVIGTTPEGRPIWMATLGPDPDRARPSVWVDGNMHATELAGSSVALAVAEEVLALHVDPSARLEGLPDAATLRVREALFYVVPRISPDGAERVLSSGAYVRSVPRDERSERRRPRWVSEDVDGDGCVLSMRRRDPTGEFVELPGCSGAMVSRRLEDEGPFYKLWPEGRVEGFDGHHVPSPGLMSDNFPDLNRNFPWEWMPDPDQEGAGPYPGSTPEARAVIEAAVARPHVVAWVNLHTFGGVFIRPRGDASDDAMNPSDLALYRQLGQWAEDLTGYPMVSGFEEFTYQPDTPVRGDLAEWAYAHRGCVSYVVELWDLFARLEMARPRRFVDYYTQMTRDDVARLVRWDREENGGRVFRPWRSVEHPQLGPVEVGGFDPRVGVSNPSYELLPEVCASHAAMTLRLAALVPLVELAVVSVEPLGEGVHLLEAVVRNLGYLPTQVLMSAERLPFGEPLRATAEGIGCEVIDDVRVEIGHLDGWGRGLRDGTGALYFLRGRGTTSERRVRWTIRGTGMVRLRAGSCRMGWCEQEVTVGSG